MGITAPTEEDDNPSMNYVKTYQNLWQALNSAKAKLTLVAQDAPAQEDRNNARAEALKVEQEMHDMDETYYAWLNDGTTINPPTSAQIAKAGEIAQTLSQEDANSARLGAILNLAGQALSIANTLHS